MIGINELTGVEQRLEKPLVLTKLNRDVTERKEFEVVGFIRRKIVFKSRPTPIMEKTHKRTKGNPNGVSGPS